MYYIRTPSKAPEKLTFCSRSLRRPGGSREMAEDGSTAGAGLPQARQAQPGEQNLRGATYVYVQYIAYQSGRKHKDRSVFILMSKRSLYFRPER